MCMFMLKYFFNKEKSKYEKNIPHKKKTEYRKVEN